MSLIKITALGLLLGSTYAAAGDCVAPAAPTIPDGSSSTMEQMIAGQTAVKAFQAANIDYMACLEPAMTAADKRLKKSSGDEKAAAEASYDETQATYNAAVSAEEEVAGQFNAAIRVYKAANPG
ncbi:MAG: hypothetical protein IMF06_06055 [Proteobacteria bacterium]|nr:hypothetical protein [Pseudomonadota bacterium]